MIIKFKTEKEMSHYVLKKLKRKLIIYLKKYNLNIAENKKILKDVTIIPKNKTYELTLGFSDNDIVIYKELESDLMQSLRKIKGINLSSIRNENKLIIPFVIIELKLDIVSHSLITYSHTAMEIKDKFPYCMFNFLIWSSEKLDITLLRQGKNFDNITILNKLKGNKLIKKDSLDNMVDVIKIHLDNIHKKGII